MPADFVGEPETKIFTGAVIASDNSDGTERGPKVSIHEARQIAREELDCVSRSWQIATCLDKSRRAAACPPEAAGNGSVMVAAGRRQYPYGLHGPRDYRAG
jgi:hypothetical protein